MALREGELARRESGAVECRGEAVRLHWTFNELPTSDSHVLEARFSCSARIADNPTDRRMFVEVFLNAADSVTFQTVAAQFNDAVRAEMKKLASVASAAEATAGTLNASWIEQLIKAAKPVAFASGLEILAPYELTVESASLQRQKLHDVARAQAQHRAVGQLEQMQHAAEVLRQFQSLRQSAPDLSAGRLLEQLAPADRGLTLRTLLLASAKEKATTTLYGVAGPFLVSIDLKQVPPRPTLTELPRTLGPLRSVQPATIDGQAQLLIGARSGVFVVAPNQASESQSFGVQSMESQLGFNAVAIQGKTLWASHSEAGIVRWNREDPAAPALVENVPGARHVKVLDDIRVVYAAGHQLFVHDGSRAAAMPSSSSADIIAILPTGDLVIVVHCDGVIALHDRVGLTVRDVRHRNTPLDAAGLMPWIGDVRLLLGTDAGPIDCIGLDDPLVTQYLSPYRGIKMVEATADLIAAVTPDRQRIVVWNTWDEQRPVGDIHVTSIARHRIADITF